MLNLQSYLCVTRHLQQYCTALCEYRACPGFVSAFFDFIILFHMFSYYLIQYILQYLTKSLRFHVSLILSFLHVEKKYFVCWELKSAWPGLQVFIMGSSLILQHMRERKQQSYSQTCNKTFMSQKVRNVLLSEHIVPERHLK